MVRRSFPEFLFSDLTRSFRVARTRHTPKTLITEASRKRRRIERERRAIDRVPESLFIPPEPSRKDVPHSLTTCEILKTVVHHPFVRLPLAAASKGRASEAVVLNLSQLSEVDV